MTYTAKDRQLGRARRHFRLRKKVAGTATRPRLAVFRSNKHIAAQVIDDRQGVTLAAASSLDEALTVKNGANKDAATAVGKLIAQRAIAAGVKTGAFDRGGSQ